MPDPDSHRADAPRTLTAMLLARITLNMPYRIVYPFLPAIARGLGVPLESASLLLTVRGLVSAAGPLYGYLADRYGRRRMMLLGLLAMVLSAAAIAIAPAVGVALVAFGLLGFAKASYDPAMQAYVGDSVPYERRGRVMGILELPWSLSWFIGVPMAGFMIAAAGWRAPFGLLAALGMLALLVLWRLCPQCGTTGGRGRAGGPDMIALRHGRRSLLGLGAMLLISALLVAANENIFIVYGAWLETQFGLAVSTLGSASVVISLAELAAEAVSAGLVDRLGKRRAVLGGMMLNVGAYLLLPRLAGTLGTALTGVVLIFLTFEFSIVCLLPLASEVAPEARGTAMAFLAAAMSLGRVISSLTGPRLWAAGGLAANGVASAAAVAVAAAILWLAVREGGRADLSLTESPDR